MPALTQEHPREEQHVPGDIGDRVEPRRHEPPAGNRVHPPLQVVLHEEAQRTLRGDHVVGVRVGLGGIGGRRDEVAHQLVDEHERKEQQHEPPQITPPRTGADID